MSLGLSLLSFPYSHCYLVHIGIAYFLKAYCCSDMSDRNWVCVCVCVWGGGGGGGGGGRGL